VKDVDSIVKRYIDVWNETDPQRRRALIAEVFAEDAEYTDPLASVAGHEAIAALVASTRAQFNGLEFSLAGPVDSHHSQARFSWHLGLPGALEPTVVGFDVAVIENDRLRSVYGFLDRVPAALA
jgi:SnoaL-like domain